MVLRFKRDHWVFTLMNEKDKDLDTLLWALEIEKKIWKRGKCWKQWGENKAVCHKTLESGRDFYFLTSSTMCSRKMRVKPSSLNIKLLLHSIPYLRKNYKYIQAGNYWGKISSKYFIGSFLSLCSSDTEEKGKKEDKLWFKKHGTHPGEQRRMKAMQSTWRTLSPD